MTCFLRADPGPSDTRAPARFRWEVIHAGVQDLLNNFNVGGDPRT